MECDHEYKEDSRRYSDKELKAALDLILDGKDKLIRSIDNSVKNGKPYIRNDYSWLVFVPPFEFVRSGWKVTLIAFLLLTNIISNYFIYSRFLVITKDAYGFTFDIALPGLVMVVLISAEIIRVSLDRWKSTSLSRFMRYLSYAELLSILGVQFAMFWAAIASWASIVVYIFFKIDFGWIKPNKYEQIELAKSLQKETKKKKGGKKK